MTHFGLLYMFLFDGGKVKLKALYCSTLAISLVSMLSSCSIPSAIICGVEVREGGKTKIKASQETLSNLAKTEKAKNSSDNFYSISGSFDQLTVLSWYQLAGLGADGSSVVLRSAEAWQKSGGIKNLLESSCEK